MDRRADARDFVCLDIFSKRVSFAHFCNIFHCSFAPTTCSTEQTRSFCNIIAVKVLLLHAAILMRPTAIHILLAYRYCSYGSTELQLPSDTVDDILYYPLSQIV